MRVLYVSDLDGTLLNKNQELDVDTCKQINQLIDKGINFTISTGRGDSTKNILKDVHFKYPIMILNGTLNYDFDNKKYVDKMPIPNDVVIKIMQALKNFDYKTFEIQTIFGGQVKRIGINNWDKKSDCLALNILHNTEKSQELSQILSKIKGINFFIHKKVYSNGESFCDIVLENISKASRLKIFKEKYNFDKVIAFGDSENDLPLAESADEFYAVENAAEIVKKKATDVIGSCYENGVVKFILKNEKLYQ